MILFERARIGNLFVRNRIVMDAINIQLGLPGDEAALGQRAIDFYVARAKGGVGLIKTTFMRPNRKLELSRGGPVVNSKRSGTWLNEIAEAVHDYGSKICVQLTPGLGRLLAPDPTLPHGGLVAPSPLPSFLDPEGQPPPVRPGGYPPVGERYVVARELTTEEIEELVKDYEFSARIIALSGMDAIEIHAHQGYLLDEFMTAIWNKRTDKYGGDLDGRMRLAYELVEAIKRAAGADYPILFKYPITHDFEGGRDIEEGLEIARRLEAVGVSAISVTAGCYETYNVAQPSTTAPRGCNLDLAEMTKNTVNIPIISSGKLGYPDLAERALSQGKLDFIALARPLLADPEWANKVKEGRIEDIKPCIGCHEGCIARVRKNHYCSCAVNPRTGVETQLALTPAEKKKFILVIGGGPAGMEAARVSKLRGHDVVLWEKGKSLGGNLIPASIPDFKDDYKILLQYLQTQINKLEVSVELEKEATPELILNAKPDVVFLALGATHAIPSIEGTEEGMAEQKVLTAVDALLNPDKIGNSVVVVGGGLIGCETALYLTKEGRTVTVVEALDSVASGMVWGNALELVKLLDDHKVKIEINKEVTKITPSGVELSDSADEKSFLEAANIVLAVGMESIGTSLEENIEDKVPQVYKIGDYVRPRKVLNAIWEGYRLARLV
jgi:2-enoate reductase